MYQTPEICPFCGQAGEPVSVHGHYQCSICGINIAPCCSGEQCSPSEEES